MNVELFEMGLAAAARAIRNGEVSSEAYARALLERTQRHAQLNAFITIDEASLMDAAAEADARVRTGSKAPLLGVPLAVKDSFLTKGLVTTLGTSVLGRFAPARDGVVVSALKAAGAIVFGKNNLVEMSYGLTGHNAHHGQARNPYDPARITGGSSSGGAASVAARLVPVALGGDTVGSTRVPASLCGVVGFKPTTGRWPSDGVAPISPTLDSPGLLARNVEDCALVDAIVTDSPARESTRIENLKSVRFAVAPRQHLQEVDGQVETAFRQTLRKLENAGAQLVEIDLGSDFHELAGGTAWPIFFHETMPAIREFLAANHVPVSFEQIYEGLGASVARVWSRFVLKEGNGSEEKYLRAVRADRTELRLRLSAIAFQQADALLFPTTPCGAPRIDEQWSFEVRGRRVADTFLSQHTHPSNSAGVPAISLPMALSSEGHPLGIELDAPAGRDRQLLALAGRVERVMGRIPAP
jgi:mandelamide amidase